MDKIRLLIESSGRKPLVIILVSLLLLTTSVMSDVASSQTSDADKQKIVRQVAKKWIEVGAEQYKKGYFKAAKQSFLRAQDYQEYLTADEQKKLNSLLEKTHKGILEREYVLETIRTADSLVKQGKPSEARAKLEEVEDSEFLTKAEKELITQGLTKLDKAPTEMQVEDELGVAITSITEELVNGKKAESKESTEQEVVPESSKHMITAAPEIEATKPVASKDTYLEVINRKRDIRQSHTRAVVNDAVAKVQNYIKLDEFDKAKEEVERAERIVNEYQRDLGDELFRQHSDELKQLAETIIQAQEQRAQQLQEQKRLDAIEAQRQDREQMEADRVKRVAELMDNAVTFQSQQRYEEALGQLERLLILDPYNNEALLLKQTLTDMISFRRQLEVQRESDNQSIDTLIGVDEAKIPYAEELTHPKNWREIIASPFRQAEPPIGRTEADVAIYKQLDEIVDTSQLTPETPFGEAIEVLKNSVDPPLKIFVSWRDLYDNADVDRTTLISMDPIPTVQLKKALELLLEAVSGGFVNIRYSVEGGVIKIATEESLPPVMETLVYDITDLIGRPADFFAQIGGTITAPTEGEAGTEQLGEQQEQLTREDIIEEALTRATNLIQLIQQTIRPESWIENGGEGSITVFESKKLIIYQTREVHERIEGMFAELRKALGNQVSIEARFLIVGENFLEDIGLDIERIRIPAFGDVSQIDIYQDSSDLTLPADTGISGSWGPAIAGGTNALTTNQFSIGNLAMLNQLQVDIIIRATQAHRDAKSLSAPKVTVLNGEMAAFQIGRFIRYPANVTTDISTIGTGEDQSFFWTVNYDERSVVSGPLLNITPIITPDKKNVLLNIVTEMREYLGMEYYPIQLPAVGQLPPGTYTIPLPQTEIAIVQTRVSVPDRATLLLGGQRLSTEVEKEAGVPVLSKVPVIGRLFSNRSKIKDSQILLILVKPTIILREEKEAEAIAAMEGNI